MHSAWFVRPVAFNFVLQLFRLIIIKIQAEGDRRRYKIIPLLCSVHNAQRYSLSGILQ